MLTQQIQSADGTVLAVDRSGSGPAVVLVVGAFCNRMTTKDLAAALADAFEVFEYDRRGRGDSGDAAEYDVQREVEDLSTVLEAAGGSPAVYGHSSGAALVLEAASQGIPMRKLAVYEPPYNNTGGSLVPVIDEIRAFVAGGRRDLAAERFMRLAGAPPEAIAGTKMSPYWPTMEGMAHTLAYDLALCNDGVAPVERFARITVPTLALAGGNSPAWAREAARAIAATVPGASERVIDGQDHGIPGEVIAPILRAFFS